VAVTIFDSHTLPGGLNTYGIAEYKLRPADSLKEVELVRSMGVTFETGVEVGTSVPIEKLERNSTRSSSEWAWAPRRRSACQARACQA